MTSHEWVLTHRRRLGGWVWVSGGLVGAGLAALGLAVGLWLARVGAYRAAPALVLLGWGLALAGLGVGWWRGRRLHRALRPVGLARAVEVAAGLRAGRLAAFASGPLHGSPALAAAADREVAGWLAAHGRGALRPLRERLRRDASLGAAVCVVDLGALASGRPAAPAGRAFWQPVATLARARGPVTLAADRLRVRRGESVRVTVTAAGRRRAAVRIRTPGEPWRDTTLLLDADGRAHFGLGPLRADHFVQALRGRAPSDSLHIRVTVPAFLADLQVVARYPAYLDLPDEPFLPGDVAVPVPVGARLVLRGEATVPLGGAALVAPDGRRVDLTVAGRLLTGELVVTADGAWRLEPRAGDGTPFEPPLPVLRIAALPDSAPAIALPVPGTDTTAPLSLRQPLVLDVRDDHRVRWVEVESRRVSRLGLEGPLRTDTVPLPPDGVERAVLQWTLDASARGLLPGDTLVYRARATDNAPTPNRSVTPTYRLRLPALDELRARTRDEASALAAVADSLADAQRALGRATEDLAAQRARGERRDGQPDEQLGYQRSEQAGDLSRQQERLLDRADALRERVRQLQEAAAEAGIMDPAWQDQLAELERLLEQAVTPEMEAALQALREALERLDAPAVQEALERLADAQRQMREELERSRALFERAALEGQMTTLAEDAEQLAAEQERWNAQAETRADDGTAAAEDRLAERAASLADALDAAAQAAADSAARASMEQQADAASRAADHMRAASQAARQGERQEARQRGGQASQAMSQMPEDLRRARDELRARWRREVLEQLDRALVEVADLATRQEQVGNAIARGDVGPDTRAAQAAVRDGVDRVIERLRSASGQNALVSPQLTAALGFARLNMTRGVEALQQATPNTRQATGFAGQALDGLNAVAHQLLRSRGDVQSAQSGSGLQEAIEQLSQLAQQQNAMAGQATGLLPLMPTAGDMVMQELQRLAQQQRQLAQDLDRLRAEQGRDGLEPLADEARELARQLESGVLDRRTVDRQERLYRRLLDQGRTLRGEEEDEQRERESRTAEPGERFVPPGARPPARGPRFPYPSWESLQRLSPEARRAVLEYFRRLNEGTDR